MVVDGAPVQGEIDENVSQESARAQPKGLAFSEWNLDHYMRRPESERAVFWKQAPGPVRAAMSEAIRDLPDGHRTRKQADEHGWVVEIV